MNPSARPDGFRETDQVKEHCGNPSVDNMLQELCSNEQPPPRNPVGPYVPDERALETFVGGAGI
jgi:hypothetical protein